MTTANNELLNNTEKWRVSAHPVGFIIEMLDEGEFTPITFADIDDCEQKFRNAYMQWDATNSRYQEIIEEGSE